MAVDVPYFHDFERLFNTCGTSDVPSSWADCAGQLEKGLSVYKPRLGTLLSNGSESGSLALTSSPTDYNAAIGTHAAATATISKILNLHEAQSLLLLKRWASKSNMQVAAGVSPLRCTWHNSCSRTRNLTIDHICRLGTK